MKFIILMTACLSFLTACNSVETPDGTIPSEYVEMAKDYTGTYSGTFETLKEETDGVLDLSIEGTKPVLKFTAKDGSTDILGGKCDSKIGRLLSVSPRKKDGRVWLAGASFEFDPGKCKNKVEGRFISIGFKFKGGVPVQIGASILRETNERRICTGRGAERDCHYSSYSFWNMGTFSK